MEGVVTLTPSTRDAYLEVRIITIIRKKKPVIRFRQLNPFHYLYFPPDFRSVNNLAYGGFSPVFPPICRSFASIPVSGFPLHSGTTYMCACYYFYYYPLLIHMFLSLQPTCRDTKLSLCACLFLLPQQASLVNTAQTSTAVFRPLVHTL